MMVGKKSKEIIKRTKKRVKRRSSSKSIIKFNKRTLLYLTIFLLIFNIFQATMVINTTNKITALASNSGTGEVSLCLVGSPELDPISNQEGVAGELFTYQTNCSSNCGEELFFAGSSIGLDSFSINQSSGLINFTPQFGEEGNHLSVVLCSKDGFEQQSASEVFYINIDSCSSNPPNLSEIPAQSAVVGQRFIYQTNCTSDCGEILVHTGSSIDMNSFWINESSGLIDFIPQHGEDGIHLTAVLCTKEGYENQSVSELFLIDVSSSITGPLNFEGEKNQDGLSVDLNWSEVPGANNYTIYYSSNITQIVTLNLSDPLPNQVSTYLTNNLNWTDNNADQVQKRYYTVSANTNGYDILTSDREVGKFTYYLDAPTSSVYGLMASNYVSIYLDKQFTAESFLTGFPGSINPTMSRLLKSDTYGEYLQTHVGGLNDGNDFSLILSDGYLVTVDQDFNYTIVGKIAEPPYILELDAPTSSVYGLMASNWKGIYDGGLIYSAEDILSNVTSNLNPTMSRLLKSDTYGEYLQTHVGGLNDGNDFIMNLGEGYIFTVDQDYNLTQCEGCFE